MTPLKYNLLRCLKDHFRGRCSCRGPGASPIVSLLSSEEIRLIDCLLSGLDCSSEDWGRRYDLLVETATKLHLCSLRSVHPILEKVFRRIHLPFLEAYERGARGVIPSHQDHIVHAACLYLLGLYLTDHLYKFRKMSMGLVRNDLIFAGKNDFILEPIRDLQEYFSYRRDEALTLPEFLKRWKTAAFFHDAGYPAEISAKMMEFAVEDLLPSVRGKDEEPSKLVGYDFRIEDHFLHLDVPQSYELPFPKFGRLRPDVFYLFAYRLAQGFFTDYTHEAVESIRQILHDNFYGASLKAGHMEHGFLGAVLFFHTLHRSVKEAAELFRETCRFNPLHAEKFYETRTGLTRLYLQGLDCAVAILLHNLQNFPHPAFKGKKINSEKYPVAFLLKLCDELQSWGRFRGEFDQDALQRRHERRVDSVKGSLWRFFTLGDEEKAEYLRYVLNFMKAGGFHDHVAGRDGDLIAIHPPTDPAVLKMLLKIFDQHDKGKTRDLIELSELDSLSGQLTQTPDFAAGGKRKNYGDLVKQKSRRLNDILFVGAVIAYLTVKEWEKKAGSASEDGIDLARLSAFCDGLKDFVSRVRKSEGPFCLTI